MHSTRMLKSLYIIIIRGSLSNQINCILNTRRYCSTQYNSTKPILTIKLTVHEFCLGSFLDWPLHMSLELDNFMMVSTFDEEE